MQKKQKSMSMTSCRYAVERSQRLVQISSCPDTHHLLWAFADHAMTKMSSFALILSANTRLRKTAYELSGNELG